MYYASGLWIGDHRLFVVDFLVSSLLGTTPKKIVWPQARRLNCKIPGTVRRYNERLEKKIRKHRFIERIGRVHQAEVSLEEKKLHLD